MTYFQSLSALLSLCRCHHLLPTTKPSIDATMRLRARHLVRLSLVCWLGTMLSRSSAQPHSVLDAQSALETAVALQARSHAANDSMCPLRRLARGVVDRHLTLPRCTACWEDRRGSGVVGRDHSQASRAESSRVESLRASSPSTDLLLFPPRVPSSCFLLLLVLGGMPPWRVTPL